MLVDNAMGDAGARVVIEEFLAGEEASFIVMVDGRTCCRSPRRRTTSACCDGDRGPNTGGMGAYSPAPVVTPALHARIMREVITADRQRHGGATASRTRASSTPA